LVTVSTKRTPNRGWLAVDLPSLRANARAVQDAARGAALLPVVKADAYGLGAVPVVRALEELEPWGFAVATVDEAIELREAGCARPLLVFTPPFPTQLADYRRFDLRAVLGDATAAEEWALPFHVEIDTGMGRCGVRWDDRPALGRFGGEHLEGAFTHFYAADTDAATVTRQWRRFEEALGALKNRPRLRHAQNSAGAWRCPAQLDLVRPGIFLYGGTLAPDLPHPSAVMAVRAPVVDLRRLSAGDGVSYGGVWRAPHDTWIATLGIGYADGVPRCVAGRAHVLHGGSRWPIVGRVTMDFIMIDVGPSGGGVRVGDVATVVGRDGDDEITLDEFAAWSDTINYEVLTRFGARLAREYEDG
jgi:alanine racemase